MTTASDASLAAAIAPPQLGEKFAPQALVPCSVEDLARYAAASGDDNPIHLDVALARSAGLPAPPVHGMLLLSRFVPALAIWRPDLILIRLSAKFLRPIFVNESGELSGRIAQIIAGQSPEEPTKFMLRLMLHNEKHELALVGEAVTFRKADL